MKCFYHTDADGKGAGRMVYEYANKDDGTDIEEYCPINYGMPFPFEDILPGELIFIVDYSIFPDEMRKLLAITENVIWIDHHKTAIDRYDDFEYQIRGLRYDGIAGCMLTFCYLTHMTNGGVGEEKPFSNKMADDAPEIMKYIGDYDVWTFVYGNDTKCFHLGFETRNFDPLSLNWEKCNKFLLKQLIEEGYIILGYRNNLAKKYCKEYGFETEFEGHKVFAMNLGLCGSEHFKSVNNGKYDIFIGFTFNGEEWSYSMRSEKVDVSEIAKKYGGGGHVAAAGFSSKELLLRKECQI